MTSGRDRLARAVWRKGSRSSPTSNNCVEVACNLPGIVAVRDSKGSRRADLRFSRQAWAAFIRAVKDGGAGRATVECLFE